jgi:hypothetical protein
MEKFVILIWTIDMNNLLIWTEKNRTHTKKCIYARKACPENLPYIEGKANILADEIASSDR